MRLEKITAKERVRYARELADFVSMRDAERKFANEIATFIRHRNWSVTEAAIECGLSQERMQQVLNGRHIPHPIKTLAAVANKIGLSRKSNTAESRIAK